jgi:hypothetical protein
VVVVDVVGVQVGLEVAVALDVGVGVGVQVGLAVAVDFQVELADVVGVAARVLAATDAWRLTGAVAVCLPVVVGLALPDAVPEGAAVRSPASEALGTGFWPGLPPDE